jgi:hypothetical protein
MDATQESNEAIAKLKHEKEYSSEFSIRTPRSVHAVLSDSESQILRASKTGSNQYLQKEHRKHGSQSRDSFRSAQSVDLSGPRIPTSASTEEFVAKTTHSRGSSDIKSNQAIPKVTGASNHSLKSAGSKGVLGLSISSIFSKKKLESNHSEKSATSASEFNVSQAASSHRDSVFSPISPTMNEFGQDAFQYFSEDVMKSREPISLNIHWNGKSIFMRLAMQRLVSEVMVDIIEQFSISNNDFPLEGFKIAKFDRYNPGMLSWLNPKLYMVCYDIQHGVIKF